MFPAGVVIHPQPSPATGLNAATHYAARFARLFFITHRHSVSRSLDIFAIYADLFYHIKSRKCSIMSNKKGRPNSQNKRIPLQQNASQESRGGHVRAEFAIIVAIVCFVAGFFTARFSADGTSSSDRTIPINVSQNTSVRENAVVSANDWVVELEKQANDNPNADSWTRLGNAFFDTGQVEKAISAYEKSLEITPDDPDVITDMGIMYRRNSQPERAIELFELAMKVDPVHEMSQFNKGIVLLYDLKDVSGAREAWQAVSKLNPNFRAPNGQLIGELVKSLQ